MLTAEVETARWFDALAEKNGREAARRRPNWVPSELFGALNRLGKGIEETPGQPGAGRPNCSAWSPTARFRAPLAKQVFEIMLETGEGAGEIVEERGLKQTSDTGAIEEAIAEILAANARQGRRV